MIKKTRILLLICLILLAHLYDAQGGFRSRILTPGGLAHVSKAIFETGKGGYIAVGISHDSVYGKSFNRLVILGLDKYGNTLWFKKYGNPLSQYLENSLITRSCHQKDAFIYYTGCLHESDKYIGVLLKINMDGDTVWQRKYFDPAKDIIPQMVTASVDNGYLITGLSQYTGNSPCLLIKTNTVGEVLWRKELSKALPNVSDGKAIIQDSASKKIVIVGYQYKVGIEDYDNILVLDSLGTQLQQHSYNQYGGRLLDMIQTHDKKLVMVGTNYPPPGWGFQEYYSFMVKADIDSLDQPLWKIENFDSLKSDNFFNCLKEAPNGDVMVGGNLATTTITKDQLDILTRLTRIDKNGNILQNKYYSYRPPGHSYASAGIRSIENTSDGGWIAAIGLDTDTKPNPFFFVKYDSLGCDSSSYYCQTVGIEETMGFRASVAIYPNPFSDRIQVDLRNMNKPAGITVKLYNVLGQEVDCEISRVDSGIILASDQFPVGIYFIRVFEKENLVKDAKILKQ